MDGLRPRMRPKRRSRFGLLCKIKPGYSDGCIKTFTAVDGMTEDELRPWFARIKLSYSCSSIVVAFVRFVVPELIKGGITHVLINKLPVEYAQDLCGALHPGTESTHYWMPSSTTWVLALSMCL